MKKQLLMFLAICTVSVSTLWAQSTKETVEIKTSAVCGMCKTTIESAVYELDGIKSVYLDVESKVASIKYDATKLEMAAIIKAITMAGYDADEILADPEAYLNLNPCCKKDAVH